MNIRKEYFFISRFLLLKKMKPEIIKNKGTPNVENILAINKYKILSGEENACKKCLVQIKYDNKNFKISTLQKYFTSELSILFPKKILLQL